MHRHRYCVGSLLAADGTRLSTDELIEPATNWICQRGDASGVFLG
jgi:hypothetical protein